MPDTAENQAAYPQHSGQKKGCGFPLMKVVGILSLASGALLHFARGTLRVSENALFAQLWPCLDQGDVLLADRGFCSFATLASLWRRGIDCVMRVHRNRHIDFRKGKALGPEDRLMVWQKCPKCPAGYSREDFAGLPSTFTVRQIRLHVGIKGWRTRTIVIVTTLLDPVLYPADALRALYLERWSVELRFREIKITLALDVLRCLTPAMIEKELFMHVIAYNLVRSLMQHASLRHDVALCRLSFKGTLDSLRHFADAIEAAHGKPRRQAELLDHLLELIAKDRLPLRPHRHEPRAKKRRPKNYYLLSRPRHQMRTPSHRNRPKKCLS
jgi:hypothetical protein